MGRKTETLEPAIVTPAAELRAELLAAQHALRQAGAGPVIVLLVGPETAGRGETADLLNAWMDPRWLVTRAWGEPSDEERERPAFWRYWRELPPRGKVALFLSAWYGPPILARADGSAGKQAFDGRMARIAAFERMLVDGGAVLIKCWLHVDSRIQRTRLETAAADPLRRWRAGRDQWRRLRLHDRFVAAWKRAVIVTGHEQAPWHVIDAADPDQQHLRVAACVRDAIRRACAGSVAAGSLDEANRVARESSQNATDHLGALDLAQDHGRRLAEPEAMGRLRRCRQRDGRPHEHAARPVGARRRRRQALRPREGGADVGRQPLECPQAGQRQPELVS